METRRGVSTVGYIRMVCSILFCFIFLFLGSPILRAGSVDKEITVSAVLGYEGYGKFGRITPAFIEVTSSVNFEGLVKIIVPTKDGEKNYAYEYPVVVDAGRHVIIRADFPLTTNDTLFSIQVVGQDGVVYASCESRIITPSGQFTELYVGVASTRERAYLSFQAQQIGDELISNFPYVTTRAFRLTTEDFTIYPEGMDSLDIIVLDTASYIRLSQAQKTALENWANEGGILVLEIDKNTPWMPYPDQASDPVELRPIFWIQIKTLEKGILSYIWIDSDQIDMMEYMSENTGLAPAVLGRLCQADLVADIVERDHYYEGSKEFSWGSDMLRSSIVKKMPNMAVYILILIAYFLLAGPILYFYLRKHDKTGLTGRWLFFLAVGFSCLIFFISYPTRFRTPFVQYVTICQIQDGQQKEETRFALRAPFHKAFYMGIDNSYRVRPILDGNYYYYDNINTETAFTESQAGLFFDSNYTAVTVEKSAPFSAEYFLIQKYQPIEETYGFLANLTFLTDTVTGTVENQSGRSLSDVILLTRERAILLGNLEAGEKVRVDGKESIIYTGYADGKEAYRMLNIPNNTEKIQTVSQQNLEKLRALKYYLKEIKIDLDSGILIGFDMEAEPDWQEGTEYPMQGVTLLTEKIRFNRTQVRQEEEILPVEEAEWIGSTMEEVRLNYEDLILSQGGPSVAERLKPDMLVMPEVPAEERSGMIYEYTITSKEDIRQITFLQNSKFPYYKGEIFLFNRITMQSYKATIGTAIPIKDLTNCFYEQNGTINLAVLYLPGEPGEMKYPLLQLKKEITLEYTFLDEDKINVNNEADYDSWLNSTGSTSIQLHYNLGSTENLWQVIFVDTIVEEESSRYQQFSGNRYFLNTENQIFERVEDKTRIFTKENLQSYIDVDMAGNYLTVQYISGTLNYGTEREICLPRICVVKKK